MIIKFLVRTQDNPNAIKQILQNLHVSIQTSLKNDVGQAGNFAVQEGQRVAHVVTGHMKRNIQLQTVDQYRVNVLSKAIYSGHENKRKYSGAIASKGPHNFFDQLYEATRKKYTGTVIMGNIIHKHRGKKLI